MTSPVGTTVAWGDGDVSVAGRWTYAWGARKRPFIHPVTTPAGHVLSREAPDDHPWHHGLWFTIKYVDGDNFWEEMAPYGVLRHDGPPAAVERPDGSVAISGDLAWIRPDRETVALTERRTFTHVPLTDDAYAIDLDTTLVPPTPVRLERTEYTTWGGYGGLTLRGAAELVDTRLLVDDGSTHDRLVAVPSRWCDLSGWVVGAERDGAADRAPVGLALLDHPANRRHPVPFYASTYDGYGEGAWTNFCNAAFLFHDGLDLAAGEELRIRHRVIVHDGHWSSDRLAEAWERWARAGAAIGG